MNNNLEWLQTIVVDHLKDKDGNLPEGSENLFPDGFPQSLNDAWQLIVQMLQVSDSLLVEKISNYSECDIANFSDVDRKSYLLVPEKLARGYGVFPIKDDGRELLLATSDPNITEAFQMVAFASGRTVKPVIASPVEIDNAILAHYYNVDNSSSGAGKKASSVIVIDDDKTGTSSKSDAPRSGIVELTSALIKKAIDSRASDFHIQPFLGGAIVRYRIDGVLQRIASLPPGVAGNIVQRFKAVGGMDPTNHLIPQDGSARVIYGDEIYDMRISTLPAGDIERLVIRFLHEEAFYSLDDIGMSGEDVEQLKKLIQYKSGIIIVTGPTGSGKTTTLYSCLSELNTADRNIITAEDPVEYRLHGASQVAINKKQGLDYAAVVRSVLRQDPDILLIGEVRDPETAEYAFRAALTGHVVFTTLHTSDAISAIERLRDLGISHRDIAYNVIAMTAQRLLRKLCEDCAVPVTEPLNSVEKVYLDITGEMPKRRPTGCSKCGHFGYIGRQPITQIVEFTPELAELLADNAHMSEIVSLARQQGMTTLGRGALTLIQQGKTTIGEALRVLGPLFWSDIGAEYEQKVETMIPVDAFKEPVKLSESEKLYSGVARILLLSLSSNKIAITESILTDTDYSITTANSIEKASELELQYHYYDLLLIDLTSRKGKEIELMDSLWAKTELRVLRILIIVTDGDDELLLELRNHAASDFILDYVYESQCQELLDTRIQTILHRSDI